MLYIINEFTVSVAVSTIISVIDGIKNTEKCPTTKDEVVKSKPVVEEDNVSDAIEEDEYEVEEDDEAPEIIDHLRSITSIFDMLDDALCTATETTGEDAEKIYDRFGNYYRTVIPYAELVSVNYQFNFVDELKSSTDKLVDIINQFTNDLLKEIDHESVQISDKLKFEIDSIKELAYTRIAEGIGRPTYNSVIITKTDDEKSDET